MAKCLIILLAAVLVALPLTVDGLWCYNCEFKDDYHQRTGNECCDPDEDGDHHLKIECPEDITSCGKVVYKSDNDEIRYISRGCHRNCRNETGTFRIPGLEALGDRHCCETTDGICNTGTTAHPAATWCLLMAVGLIWLLTQDKRLF